MTHDEMLEKALIQYAVIIEGKPSAHYDALRSAIDCVVEECIDALSSEDVSLQEHVMLDRLCNKLRSLKSPTVKRD